jgi:competence protein ComEC
MVERRAPCRQPLLWAALAFAGGIALGARFWRPAPWWLAAAAIFAVAAARFCVLYLRDAPEATEPTLPATTALVLWRIPVLVLAALRSGFAKLGKQLEQDIGQGWGQDRDWLLFTAWGLALASLLALGAWCQQISSAVHPANLTAYLSEHRATVCGHVIRDGLVEAEKPGWHESLDLETEQIASGAQWSPVAAGVRVSITGKTRPPKPFTYGQRLCFVTKLRAVQNFQNPGAFDHREYLMQQGIAATAAAKAEQVLPLPGFGGSRWELRRSRARRSILRHIRVLWKQEEAPLFDALLIGERAFIDPATYADWQRTGLYHLLVVSGLKVGILAFFVLWLIRLLRGGELAATASALLVAVLYAYVAEMAAPAMRATLMLAIYLLTRMLYRDRSVLNALGAAALILLVARPQALFEASFQLTFFCMLALGGLPLPLLQRTSEPYRGALRNFWNTGYDFALPPRLVQFRLDLRLLATRLGALLPLPQEAGRRVAGWGLCLPIRALLFLHDAGLLSLTTQLAMILPMARYFHRAAWAGVLANMIAVPMTGVLLPAAAVALALSYVWLPGARAIAPIASRALAVITWSAHGLAGLHFGSLRLPTPSPTRIVAVLAAFILALVLIRRRAWLAAGGVAALVAASVWMTSSPALPQTTAGVLEVAAIDVGQAESTLVITPQGRTILVDAGGPIGSGKSELDFGEEVVSPYLWERGFDHLDAVLLTHGHSDHYGGMHAVIANFHPRELWLGLNPATKPIQDLKSDIARIGGRVVQHLAGDQFAFGGAEFVVLAPPRDWQVGDRAKNNDSVVLLVRFGATSAMLTGDIEKQVERQIATQPWHVDVLKVPHNGSKTSTTAQFLAATQPRFAYLFAGVHNRFNLPNLAVLERLAQAHVATYRTDTMGSISFLLDGKSVTPRVLSLEERTGR